MGLRITDDSELTNIDFIQPIPVNMDRIRSMPPDDLQQEAQNWCWAACAELIIKLFGNHTGQVSQCLLAEKYIDHPISVKCCTNKKACDKPLGLTAIKNIYTIDYNITAEILPPEKLSRMDKVDLIKKQIHLGCPVEIYLLTRRDNKDFAHVAIVEGWSKNARGKFCLLIKDPMGTGDDGCRTLDEIDSSWTAAIINIKRTE